MSKEINKPKILCVDDEPKNLTLLEALLVPRGYEVILAENGEKALAQVETDPPDLILLDIIMPNMSGFEVLQKLRSDEKTRLIPVVMVTALNEMEDRVKAIEAGCDDFISKPFDKIELLARVKSLIRISYYRRQLDEKEKFKAVVDEMYDGIAICSLDWIIKDSNASALRYLNITDSANVNLIEILFKNYSISVPKEKLMDLSIPHKTFDVVRQETEKTKALYLEVSLDVVKNPLGEVSSIVFVLRDVTEVRKEERLKQNFLSSISHKLRTPLMIITQYASMLQEEVMGPLNEDQQKAIHTLAIKSFLLKDLVEELLDFTMIYNQNLAQSKEIIELKSYFHSITDAIIKRVNDKKIEMDIDCQEDIRLKVNKKYFERIMENLIENAIKFNDKEIVKILVTAKKESGKMEISVTDNGIGIPNEEYERIFEKFYQVEKYFTGQVEGFGIGLAIVRRLVEELGGKIQVKSNLGQGTIFTFTLPESI